MKSFVQTVAKPFVHQCFPTTPSYICKVPLYRFSSFQFGLLSKKQVKEPVSEIEKMNSSSGPSNYFDENEMQFMDEFHSTENINQNPFSESSDPSTFSPENSEALFQQFMKSIDEQATQLPDSVLDPESDDAMYVPNNEEIALLKNEIEKMKSNPEYLKTLVVSQKMLRNPNMDITEIAEELGTTPEALLKTFSQRFGSDAEEGESAFPGFEAFQEFMGRKSQAKETTRPDVKDTEELQSIMKRVEENLKKKPEEKQKQGSNNINYTHTDENFLTSKIKRKMKSFSKSNNEEEEDEDAPPRTKSLKDLDPNALVKKKQLLQKDKRARKQVELEQKKKEEEELEKESNEELEKQLKRLGLTQKDILPKGKKLGTEYKPEKEEEESEDTEPIYLQVANRKMQDYLQYVLTYENKDPKLQGVRIKLVKMSPNYKKAQVKWTPVFGYVSFEERQSINERLQRKAGFFASRVSYHGKLKFTPVIEFYFDLDVRDREKVPKTLKEAVIDEILQRVGVVKKEKPENLKDYQGKEIESSDFVNYKEALKNRDFYFGNKSKNTKNKKTRRK